MLVLVFSILVLSPPKKAVFKRSSLSSESEALLMAFSLTWGLLDSTSSEFLSEEYDEYFKQKFFGVELLLN